MTCHILFEIKFKILIMINFTFDDTLQKFSDFLTRQQFINILRKLVFLFFLI